MPSSKSLPSAPGFLDKQVSRTGSADEPETPKENLSARRVQEPEFEPIPVSYVDSSYGGHGYTTPTDLARHDLDQDATTKSARRHSIEFQTRIGHVKKEKMAEDDFDVSSKSDAVCHAIPKVSTEDSGISESPELKVRRFIEAPEILRALNIVQRIRSMFESRQPKMTRGWPAQYTCV